MLNLIELRIKTLMKYKFSIYFVEYFFFDIKKLFVPSVSTSGVMPFITNEKLQNVCKVIFEAFLK